MCKVGPVLMAATDALKIHYTATVEARIAATVWLTAAIRSLKQRQPFRTPFPLNVYS